jgi:WD40 repeat protein
VAAATCLAAGHLPEPEQLGAAAAAGGRHVEPLVVDVTAAAFSPDNKYVLVGYSGGAKLLRLWEVAGGKELRSFPGHTDRVVGVAFVAGAKRVLSGSRDGKLLLHDAATGKLLRGLKAYRVNISKLAASPDGRRALTAGVENDQETAKLWDPDGLRLLRTFGGPDFQAWGLALSPAKRWALSGCLTATAPPGLVRLWDLDTGRPRHVLPGSAGWWGGVAAFSPDSRLALIAKSEHPGTPRMTTRLALWDVKTGQVRRLLDGAGAPAQFTPDGKQVVSLAYYAVGKARLTFWDVASGKAARSLKFAQPGKEYPRFFLSADGRLALVAAGHMLEGPRGRERPPEPDLRMTIWNLTTGRVVRRWTQPRPEK